MRFGGWQRTGVILSIVWVLGAPVFAWDVYTDYGAQRVETELLKCEIEYMRGPHIAQASDACTQKVQDAYARAYRMMWVKLAIIALLPVALAWAGGLLSRGPLPRMANSSDGAD